MKDFKKYLSLATSAAKEAGDYIRSKWEGSFQIEHKGVINLVTEVDKQSEKMIVEEICKNYPDHDILAEEGTDRRKNSKFRWVIDPLDGTTNFAHGYPAFVVSIGLEYEGKPIVGVVYDPTREEMFTATKGGGAFLSGKKIFVSKQKKLSDSLLCTGFGYDVREVLDNNLGEFSKMLKSAQAIRRDGAAALDLCYVACGRFDGFWERGLLPWDMAAGILLILEAGGQVTAYDGSPFSMADGKILASNALIHKEISQILTQ